MENPLALLASRCKGGVSLSINAHRGSGMDLGEYVRTLCKGTPQSTVDACVQADTLVSLYFYPTMPNQASYLVVHYDLDMAIQEALSMPGVWDAKRVSTKEME